MVVPACTCRAASISGRCTRKVERGKNSLPPQWSKWKWELAHHLVSRRRAHAEAGGPRLPEAPHGIADGLAMHAGVQHHVSARMRDEEADHGHDGARPGRHVAEEAAQIEIDESAAHRVDVDHVCLTF